MAQIIGDTPTSPDEVSSNIFSSLDWRAIVAGAIGAAAISAVLLAFGSALGLSMTSARPYGGFSGTTLAIVLTLWFAFVHVSAFAAGGYISGRARSPFKGSASEIEFMEGSHGFLVWALGTLLGVYLLASAVGGIANKAADAAGRVAEGATSAVTSSAAELASYNLDRIMRKAPVASNPADTAANVQTANELTRILGNAVVQGSLPQPDKDYLVQTIVVRTGLPAQDATARVEDAYNTLLKAKTDAEAKTRDVAEKARKNSILGAFLTAAISLAGLVAAVWGAVCGGKDRLANLSPRVFGRERFW
jgi:hypothetical protein